MTTADIYFLDGVDIKKEERGKNRGKWRTEGWAANWRRFHLLMFRTFMQKKTRPLPCPCVVCAEWYELRAERFLIGISSRRQQAIRHGRWGRWQVKLRQFSVRLVSVSAFVFVFGFWLFISGTRNDSLLGFSDMIGVGGELYVDEEIPLLPPPQIPSRLRFVNLVGKIGITAFRLLLLTIARAMYWAGSCFQCGFSLEVLTYARNSVDSCK